MVWRKVQMCVCTPTRQAPAYRVDSVSEMLTFSTPGLSGQSRELCWTT